MYDRVRRREWGEGGKEREENGGKSGEWRKERGDGGKKGSGGKRGEWRKERR